jgi:hypothetical protein
LQQEFIAPAARATLHRDAFLTRMLLEQGQAEPIEPSEVLPCLPFPDA